MQELIGRYASDSEVGSLPVPDLPDWCLEEEEVNSGGEEESRGENGLGARPKRREFTNEVPHSTAISSWPSHVLCLPIVAGTVCCQCSWSERGIIPTERGCATSLPTDTGLGRVRNIGHAFLGSLHNSIKLVSHMKVAAVIFVYVSQLRFSRLTTSVHGCTEY